MYKKIDFVSDSNHTIFSLESNSHRAWEYIFSFHDSNHKRVLIESHHSDSNHMNAWLESHWIENSQGYLWNSDLNHQFVWFESRDSNYIYYDSNHTKRLLWLIWFSKFNHSSCFWLESYAIFLEFMCKISITYWLKTHNPLVLSFSKRVLNLSWSFVNNLFHRVPHSNSVFTCI